MTVNRGLLIHHARRGVVAIQEDGSRGIGRTVEQRVEVLGVVVGLHHGVVDVGAGRVNPTHNLGICLGKRIKVDNRHATGVLVAHILLFDFLIRLARLLVANLCVDKDGGSGNDQANADDDEQNGNDGAALFARRLGIA